MIPFSSFGTNSISWNSEEDLFSVQYENVTVKDILDYIEKHSKYIFIYSANVQKNLNNKVSISVSNKKIDAVLKELFSETGGVAAIRSDFQYLTRLNHFYKHLQHPSLQMPGSHTRTKELYMRILSATGREKQSTHGF